MIKNRLQRYLYVRDGETAVIGGIYERAENDRRIRIAGITKYTLIRMAFQKID